MYSSAILAILLCMIKMFITIYYGQSQPAMLLPIKHQGCDCKLGKKYYLYIIICLCVSNDDGDNGDQ